MRRRGTRRTAPSTFRTLHKFAVLVAAFAGDKASDRQAGGRIGEGDVDQHPADDACGEVSIMGIAIIQLQAAARQTCNQPFCQKFSGARDALPRHTRPLSRTADGICMIRSTLPRSSMSILPVH